LSRPWDEIGNSGDTILNCFKIEPLSPFPYVAVGDTCVKRIGFEKGRRIFLLPFSFRIIPIRRGMTAPTQSGRQKREPRFPLWKLKTPFNERDF